MKEALILYFLKLKLGLLIFIVSGMLYFCFSMMTEGENFYKHKTPLLMLFLIVILISIALPSEEVINLLPI